MIDFEEEYRRAKEEREHPTDPVKKSHSKGNHPPQKVLQKPVKTPSRDRIEMALVKDGWLDKKSEVTKRWKRRYFICTDDTLNFYKSNKVLILPFLPTLLY